MTRRAARARAIHPTASTDALDELLAVDRARARLYDTQRRIWLAAGIPVAVLAWAAVVVAVANAIGWLGIR